MKGIILAGGTGSRLWPSTIGISKQLIPIYDKPLIFYPLSTLMLSGIREILVITTPNDSLLFQKLLGDGQDIGLKLNYAVQENPEGLAQSFIIGKDFIGQESVALILGDNIFHGDGLGRQLNKCTKPDGAIIFGYEVSDPRQYGVAEIDSNGFVISIEEKPKEPRSNYAIPGLYFLENSVIKKAQQTVKSERGELEITSVLEMFRAEGRLTLNVLPRGTAWLDCGTPKSLNDASNYIRVIEERHSSKVAVIEEIAWRNGWISLAKLGEIAKKYNGNDYGRYLSGLSDIS